MGVDNERKCILCGFNKGYIGLNDYRAFRFIENSLREIPSSIFQKDDLLICKECIKDIQNL